MLAIPPFDAKQVKALQLFLDAPDRSTKSMSYAESAGFLFSIACAPELVKPAEWLPLIIDPDNAEATSLENMQAITVGLMSLYNEMTRQVQKVDVKLPLEISFLDDPMANLNSESSISQWARGFRSGYIWLEEMWTEYTPEAIKEEAEHQLLVLFFFSSQKGAVALYEEVNNKDVTFEKMAEDMQRLFPDAQHGVALLGNSIQQALAARDDPTRQPVVKSEKVGRNEPCPCGSGMKFKKCCGAA